MNTLFSYLVDDIVGQIQPVCDQLSELPIQERVEALNQIRAALHEVSPFKSEPVDNVQWIAQEHVSGNDYNPNKVAPPEMRLLKLSIQEDGVTQPVVGWRVNENGEIEVVDGYHRTKVIKTTPSIQKRLHGYVPVAIANASRDGANDRMAATIRHNRARGVHSVIPMADLVAMLLRNGWSDDQIAKELGMDADEVLRFKQNTGLPDLFKERKYSNAWQ